MPKLAGLADLFAWPLRTSHYLELVNPLWTTHTLQARVEDVKDETRDARTITLRPSRGWRRHRAGQHVRVGVPIGGRHHVRTYSISSAPERPDGCITITVKAMAGGRVSRHLARRLQAGDYLPLGSPQGDFVLPEAVPVRPLFITAGSGITPVMSMLRSLEARGELPDVDHLHYHSQPDAGDVIFGNELARLARVHPRYRLHLLHTRSGHFTAEQLSEVCPDHPERETYACGPPGLLGAVEQQWEQAGLARRLHVERFRAPLAAVPAEAAGGRVLFARSRRAVQADGRTSLLRVAEDAGLNPRHGCRMGICHSCTVTLVSGCVRDLRHNGLVAEPGTKVQICVSAAAGNVEVEL